MQVLAHDPTWAAIKTYLEQELDRLRLKNDDLKLTESETVAVRARIAAVKDLLALPVKLAARTALSEPG